MMKFVRRPDGVFLRYTPEFESSSWIDRSLNETGRVTISRVFTFQRGDVVEGGVEDDGDIDLLEDDAEYTFRLGDSDGEYYAIQGRVFGIEGRVLIASAGIKWTRTLFVAERNISIFARISDILESRADIVIGGRREGAIPVEIYLELLRRFPNTTELRRYAHSRISTILKDYLDGVSDEREAYEAYLSKRAATFERPIRERSELIEAEINKYSYVRDVISSWLKSKSDRSELEWQDMILSCILLIFPKYVAVLKGVRIKDFYFDALKPTNRYIDIALVDAGGNVDVIEIKKPFEDALLKKAKYRDNFVPSNELSGSIMQAEKYLFHLSKWGVEGERLLTKKHSSKLPSGMQIRITNPKAMIILGRDRRKNGDPALTAAQVFDLEVIKRKYANMIDVLTYDDLLRRLENIIGGLRARAATAALPTP